jgi:hypothetical protein
VCVSACNFVSDSLLMKLRRRLALASQGNQAMQSVRATTLIPRGFLVDDAVNVCVSTLIAIGPMTVASPCPACGAISARVHSRYMRRPSDLPMAGRRVRLVLRAQRFHCDAVLCGRLIFTERFDEDVLAPRARRAAWLAGRPAASFAGCLA